MNTLRAQMQALFTFAQTWDARIKRTTFSDRVDFQMLPSGEFTITAHWTSRKGEAGQYTKSFSYDMVFGSADRRSDNPQPQQPRCNYIQAFMREVLHSRGVA